MKKTKIVTKDNIDKVLSLIKDALMDSLEAGNLAEISYGELTRSKEQNAKFHALLKPLSEQCLLNGNRYKPSEWKCFLVSGFSHVSGIHNNLLTGLEGEPLVLYPHTHLMSIKQMADLITYTEAFAITNGVNLEKGEYIE